MSAQQDVYAALSASVAVTDLVSARIYPDEAAQDAELPLVIHQATQAEPLSTLAGPVLGRSVLLSVTVWAASRNAANVLADACAAALVAAGLQWISRDDSIFDTTTGAYASVIGVQAWD